MVVFTSFQMSHKYHGDKFSIAMFQPSGFNFPELLFFAPVSEGLTDIRTKDYLKSLNPHDFYDGLEVFENELTRAFGSRMDEIIHFSSSLTNCKNVVLCCWCPYSKSTTAQVKELGVFACHSGLVSKIITRVRPDLEILLDRDRAERLVPQWRYGYGAQGNLFLDR